LPRYFFLAIKPGCGLYLFPSKSLFEFKAAI
jgi:hypothetical protein